MAELYINRTSPIRTKIYWGGEISNADSTVLADVFLIDEFDSTVSTLQGRYTAIKEETDIGTYYISIPVFLFESPKKFKIVWLYTVSGNSGSHVDYIDIVTPYANMSDIIEDLNFGTDPSDPNYKSYHDIQMAEKYARKLIELYTTQFFYPYYDTHVAYGYGSDILPLPFKLNELTQLYENDVLIYDSEDPTVTWLYTPIITESGFGIRVNKNDMADGLVYSANGLVPPTIYDQNYSGAFKKEYRYVVKGKFGWTSVPDNVEEACIILINDFFNKDLAWRNRYVKKIQTFDWTFEYMEDAHRGTGNYYADMLLQPYVLSGMIVV